MPWLVETAPFKDPRGYGGPSFMLVAGLFALAAIVMGALIAFAT
jgi:hypothetical protein